MISRNTAFRESNLPLPSKQTGKVRDWYSPEEGKRLIVTTDRISAFDVVLPKGIPFKGQVLNQIAAQFLDSGFKPAFALVV